MKNRFQSKKPHFKHKPYNHQAESSTITIEQTASTSIASNRAWVWLALVLVVVVAGLYWLNDQQGDQPDWVYQSLDDDSSTAESLIDTEVGEQSEPLLEEDLNSSGMSVGRQNEQLVRRFYDEVLNQRQLEGMDDLFAKDFTYQGNGVTSPTQNLAALKEQLRAESFNYGELTYAIEEVLVEEEWIIVNWSAVGRPVNAPLTEAPQRWSGCTGWQIGDGKIAWMLVYDAGSEPQRSEEDNFWQSDPFQNDQRLNE